MEQKNKFSIRDWSEEDRPREKMIKKGVGSLSDSELLAIILGSGSTKESAVELAKRMLNSVDNNLSLLSKMSVHELRSAFHGVGQAKAVSILATFELGKRRQLADIPDKVQLNSSKKIYELMYPLMADLKHEECWAIYMNSSNRLIDMKKISSGGITETTVDPRIILKHAIQHMATALVLCHNHPSGNIQPSDADNRLTKRLNEASKMMSICMLDHLVICDGKYFSYADQGLL
ncbi:MAG: DNA repair protein RadC [Bacteroidales bacterium]|jgi:DNA repair protein RadC|nr:DNA repair protein RadC [Bacteroidales bacterium]OQC04148.1 MAG: hypothetical protein BWX77_00271 [Bacteroidetes bacterium ADurb.Bin090]MBP8982764.1 DNA repair protein RadC [Bacteroidales bacterium]HOD26625.1 DNA repair protein RadC [Bacteroidales bacterium]HPH57205.1 DNA repair protein RadC [Bacteroidales bacterium]